MCMLVLLTMATRHVYWSPAKLHDSCQQLHNKLCAKMLKEAFFGVYTSACTCTCMHHFHTNCCSTFEHIRTGTPLDSWSVACSRQGNTCPVQGVYLRTYVHNKSSSKLQCKIHMCTMHASLVCLAGLCMGLIRPV